MNYDNCSKNIFIIGPMGSGKSNFINWYLNKQIANSSDSHESVTKLINAYKFNDNFVIIDSPGADEESMKIYIKKALIGYRYLNCAIMTVDKIRLNQSLMNMLKYYGELFQTKLIFFVLFTKSCMEEITPEQSNFIDELKTYNIIIKKAWNFDHNFNDTNIKIKKMNQLNYDQNEKVRTELEYELEKCQPCFMCGYNELSESEMFVSRLISHIGMPLSKYIIKYDPTYNMTFVKGTETQIAKSFGALLFSGFLSGAVVVKDNIIVYSEKQIFRNDEHTYEEIITTLKTLPLNTSLIILRNYTGLFYCPFYKTQKTNNIICWIGSYMIDIQPQRGICKQYNDLFVIKERKKYTLYTQNHEFTDEVDCFYALGSPIKYIYTEKGFLSKSKEWNELPVEFNVENESKYICAFHFNNMNETSVEQKITLLCGVTKTTNIKGNLDIGCDFAYSAIKMAVEKSKTNEIQNCVTIEINLISPPKTKQCVQQKIVFYGEDIALSQEYKFECCSKHS